MNNVATFHRKRRVFWSFKDSKSLRENINVINFIKAKSLKSPPLASPRGHAAPCIKPDHIGLNTFLAGLKVVHDSGK